MFTETPRKVHFHHDQGGATIGISNRPFANTLCKMNSAVPESHITTDPDKVTCKICRKDARFKRQIAAKRLLLDGFDKPSINETYGKMAYPPQMYGRATRPHMVNGMKARYRRTWLGKLVLQVEETVPYNYDPEHDIEPGGYTGRWRDARLEDLGGGVV